MCLLIVKNMNKDVVLIAIWSLNLVLLIANLVWMIVTEISFQKRCKKIQEQLNQLKENRHGESL